MGFQRKVFWFRPFGFRDLGTGLAGLIMFPRDFAMLLGVETETRPREVFLASSSPDRMYRIALPDAKSQSLGLLNQVPTVYHAPFVSMKAVRIARTWVEPYALAGSSLLSRRKKYPQPKKPMLDAINPKTRRPHRQL